jgi:hypothetical protein
VLRKLLTHSPFREDDVAFLLDINIITVGTELFAGSLEHVNDAIADAKGILKGCDIGVGTVAFFTIPSVSAGGFTPINSASEAVDLTHEFALANTPIDVFFVKA